MNSKLKIQKEKAQLLYDCPLCGRRNFSAKGIQAHWCPSYGGRRLKKKLVAEILRGK